LLVLAGGKKMTRQKQDVISEDEMSLLEENLTPEEIFIVGFLKGFNRENMREWKERGLGAFRNPYYF
jgi:hypothetical protein